MNKDHVHIAFLEYVQHRAAEEMARNLTPIQPSTPSPLGPLKKRLESTGYHPLMKSFESLLEASSLYCDAITAAHQRGRDEMAREVEKKRLEKEGAEWKANWRYETVLISSFILCIPVVPSLIYIITKVIWLLVK